MALALGQAQKGIGHVEPNPAVGAVITRGTTVLGRGYHRIFGGPHAEIEAINDALRKGRSLKNATLYVTLEPCCHWGKTPPCVDALIRAGIRTVIAATRDPSEKVAGKGFAALKKAGLKVRLGLLRDQAEAINPWFYKFHRTGRPWVIAKWAQTLDGKFAARSGHSRWISSETSRLEAHRLRQSCQAVVVGIGTVLADDPQLTVRIPGTNPGLPRVPDRVVVDPNLRIPETSVLVRTARQTPTWVIITHRASKAKILRLERLGVQITILHADSSGNVRVGKFLDFAARRNWSRVLVEGGPGILSRFLRAGGVDEIVVFQSEALALDDQAPQLRGSVTRTTGDFLKSFKFREAALRGEDVVLRLWGK